MSSTESADRSRLRALSRRASLLRASDVLAAGVHPRTLYRLRDRGDLEQVSRGIYRVASDVPPPHLDLLTVALRVPGGVVCLVSALAFLRLTDEIPHEVMVALPRRAARPVVDQPPIRVFHLSGPGYALGIEHHRIAGVDLRVYGATKTILDCFRFRNRIGEDVAVRALALALRTRAVRPGPLMEMAAQLRVQRVLAPYLKALA